MQHGSSNPHLAEAKQLITNGKLAEAIAFLYQTLKQHPTIYEGWLLLSKCLFEAQYRAQAIDVARHAENFDPLRQSFEEIQTCMQQKRFDDASRIALQMQKVVPYHPRALYTQAHVALALNKPEQCASILEEGVSHLPANTVLRHLLTDSYVQTGLYAKAITEAELIVQLAPNFESWWKLIGLLQKYAQHDKLLDTCDKAQNFAKGDNKKLSQLLLIRGQCLRVRGDREDCVAALKQSLKTDPNNADAWLALADMKNYSFSESEKESVLALVNNPTLPDKLRSVATFALAKATELSAGMTASMPLYHRANQLKSTAQFDIQPMLDEFEERRNAYTKEALIRQSKLSASSPTPIFIVGLPRSGSTLIEQILASHPLIEGTIEQPTLTAVEKQAARLCSTQYANKLHDSLKELSSHELTILGQSYLDKGVLFRSGSTPFFTDKQPFNFRLVGLIHKILPNAIIVDIRRNAMDCGLSLYKQHFHSGVSFSYNLAHIAKAYTAYTQLMAHWDSVLPGRVLKLQYEHLIKDPEAQVKRLLEHVGVNFDSSCLNFYETKRNIHTASSEQVREAINSKGINNWQEVADSLGDLLHLKDS